MKNWATARWVAVATRCRPWRDSGLFHYASGHWRAGLSCGATARLEFLRVPHSSRCFGLRHGLDSAPGTAASWGL